MNWTANVQRAPQHYRVSAYCCTTKTVHFIASHMRAQNAIAFCQSNRRFRDDSRYKIESTMNVLGIVAACSKRSWHTVECGVPHTVSYEEVKCNVVPDIS